MPHVWKMNYFSNKIYNATSITYNPDGFLLHLWLLDYLPGSDRWACGWCSDLAGGGGAGLALSLAPTLLRNAEQPELHFPACLPPFPVGVCLKGMWGKSGKQWKEPVLQRWWRPDSEQVWVPEASPRALRSPLFRLRPSAAPAPRPPPPPPPRAPPPPRCPATA